MNNYYMAHWKTLRTIEKTSQQMQNDTMRFSTTVKSLSVSFIKTVMTLIAFMPVLLRLSANVTKLPLVSHVPESLVVIAIVWSVFGTVFLTLIDIRLPKLQFRNQQVKTTYRKE